MPAPRIAFGQELFNKQLEAMQAEYQVHIEKMEVDYKKAGTLKIFNVNQKDFICSSGGLGSHYIPACPEGKIYGRPLTLWKNLPEGRTTDNTRRLRMALLNGYLVAESIVGYGGTFSPNDGLRKLGVFTCDAFATMMWDESGEDHSEVIPRSGIFEFTTEKRQDAQEINVRKASALAVKAFRQSVESKGKNKWQPEFLALDTDEKIKSAILRGDLPTEEEIEDANKRLDEYCQTLVTMANEAYAAGDRLEATQKPYLWAAKRTGNQGLPWAQGVIMMSQCHWCMTPLHPQAIICIACKGVAPGKEQQVIDARLPGYEHLWSEAAKGKNKAQPGA